MTSLPPDPDTALATAVVIVTAEEHRRGVWAMFADDQAAAIQAVVDADSRGQLTRHEIVTRLHQIARGAS